MLPHEPVAMTTPPPASTVTARNRMLGLALLVATNCLLLALSEWALAESHPGNWTYWNTLPYGFFGHLVPWMVTAQFLFIGFWCALAPERLVVRFVVGVLLAGLLLGVRSLGYLMGDLGPMSMVLPQEAGMYCGQALIVFLLLRALRPWCGWRLAWEGTPRADQSRQFRILDLFAWTAAVAIPLGLVQTIYGQQAPQQALDAAMTLISTLPVMIPVLRWAIHPARKRHWLIGAIIWPFAWTAVVIVAPNPTPYILFWINGAGLPASFWKWEFITFAFWSADYLTLVLVSVGNVWALEKIGLRIAQSPRRKPG